MVRQMDNREESGGVTGHSLLVTIKAYLSPVERKGEKDDTRYRINVLDLDPGFAALVAKAVCVALVAVTGWACGRDASRFVPERRILIELGLWFMLFLLISPEVRRAQMLSVFTAGFGLMLTWSERRVSARLRWASLASLILALVCITIASRIREGYWREWVVLHGGLTLAIGTLWGMLLVLRSRREGDPESRAAECSA